jgi:endonuclease III
MNISKKTRIKLIIEELSKIYTTAKIQLNYSNPFELLIATILSSQCTDVRVNIVTEKLFKKYISPRDFYIVPVEELERDIFSTGFYKAKANNIQKTTRIIDTQLDGKVPSTMDELLKLPGVGRKTANVVLGHCFNISGIVVDTHVKRITNLLELVESQDAEKIEFELMKIINKAQWVVFTHYMINLGREFCIARRPKCLTCPIAKYCPTGEVNNPK